MSKLWEVDPETRSKLQEIQKTQANNRCVDCGAPSPQWVSPKFGIFFCLACSGIHRSLGVHISFVRSISMDKFKIQEVQRMALGGNRPWKAFFDAHDSNTLAGRTFDASTIGERYDCEAGEEWKERLACRVEGRAFDAADFKNSLPRLPSRTKKSDNTALTPTPSERNTPQRGASPAGKARNEAYFERMGSANAERPADVPPSQGGKYAGFGSAPAAAVAAASSDGAAGAMPGMAEFERDPMAALSRGFGWLSSTVSKQAVSVHANYVAPTARKLAEADLAAQARQAALQVGKTGQHGIRGLSDTFERFIDPDATSSAGVARGVPGSTAPGGGNVHQPEKKEFWDSFGEPGAGPPRDRQEFWDDFGAAGHVAAEQKKSSAIGTAAMKPSAGGGGGGGGRKEDGEWGEW